MTKKEIEAIQSVINHTYHDLSFGAEGTYCTIDFEPDGKASKLSEKGIAILELMIAKEEAKAIHRASSQFINKHNKL